MRLARAVLLLTLIVASRSASAEPSAPERTFLLWLEALRMGDVPRMAEQTKLPFAVAGFYVQMDKDCDQTVVPNLTPKPVIYNTSMLRIEAANPLKLARGLRCLMHDSMLRRYLPILQAGRWLAGPDANGNSGRIARTTSLKVAKVLRRFAPQIQELARKHDLVQAIWTDNNGVTVTALAAVANDDAHQPLLAALFVSEQFEE
jgi:hypothetical protein